MRNVVYLTFKNEHCFLPFGVGVFFFERVTFDGPLGSVVTRIGKHKSQLMLYEGRIERIV